MNQKTMTPAVERRAWPQHEYEALGNRCVGIKGRESLAVRQMVRDAVTVRGLDPKCIQLAQALVSFQLVNENFAVTGESRPLTFEFNTLTIVYGIHVFIRGDDAATRGGNWFFNIDRSQRNAIATSRNQASLAMLFNEVGGSWYVPIQPMYGEYKVDWTGTLTCDERAALPVVVARMTWSLVGLEIWQRNGPVLGR